MSELTERVATEQEKEQEAYEPKDYTTEKDAPTPWPIEALSGQPDGAGFYPLSQFAVMKSFGIASNRLKFPEYLWVSSNYYSQSWCTLSHRRLRNSIVIMEWCPDVMGTDKAAQDTPHTVTATDDAQLKASFGIMSDGANGSIKLVSDEFVALMQALDINVQDQVCFANNREQ